MTPRQSPVTRADQIGLRVTPDERDAFTAAATACGLPLSEWIRLVLRDAADLPVPRAKNKPRRARTSRVR